MILYKYAHKHGLDILRSLEIKITPPIQFNDPFEFLPVTVRTVPLATIRQMEKTPEFLSRMYAAAKARGFRGSYNSYKGLLRRFAAGHAKVAASNPEIPKQIRNHLLDFTNRTVGVLSLSSPPDNTLMWSHYADFHRGTVLGIDIGQMPPEWAAKLVKVEYSDNRVEMNLKSLPGSREHKAFIHAMMKTKNSAWKYEDEYRLPFDLRTARRRTLSDGSIGFFAPIPPAAIREVILGCRCTAETERDVREALTAVHFKHVILKKAALHDTKFELVLNPA